MTENERNRRFDHHPPSPERQQAHEKVRALTKAYAEEVDKVLMQESREASLFFTSVEEALFWANAAIARNLP